MPPQPDKYDASRKRQETCPECTAIILGQMERLVECYRRLVALVGEEEAMQQRVVILAAPL